MPRRRSLDRDRVAGGRHRLIATCVVVSAAWTAVSGCRREAVAPLRPLPPAAHAFGEGADAPTATVVVATLDAPIDAAKSAMWCASFELAWRALEGRNGGPIELRGAEAACRRLHAAPDARRALPDGSWYAAAGLVKDGIVEAIGREMAARFPGQRVPEFPGVGDDDAIAYAFLAADALFETEFFDEETIPFSSGNEARTPVAAFGVSHQRDAQRVRKTRAQVDVLAYERTPGDVRFVLDLSKRTPIQVLVARVPPAATLAETVAGADALAEGGPAEPLDDLDTLRVPRISFLLHHSFGDLEGPERKVAAGLLRGYFVASALQTTRFELGKAGAFLRSEARLVSAKAKRQPRHLVVSGPFLFVLRKRGETVPFFALWVATPELLVTS